MDPGAILARRVFIPFFERRWGLYSPQLQHALEQSQHDSPEEVREQQLTQMRALLAFARDSTPWYRERLSGVDVDDLRSEADLTALPVLTKSDLRDSPEALISEGFDRAQMFHRRTGGSTGVPVHVWWDDLMHVFTNAATRRHDRWAGFVPGQKKAALWGDTDKTYPLRERIYKALCERTIYLDTLHMDEQYLAGFVERARRFGPEVLMGHAHSIYFLTRYLVDQGIDDIRFAGIISTAETLSPAERTFIESHFGQVVFDRYGCEEVSLIASECEAHDGLHICAEGMLVEVVGGDEKVPGKLLVTSLINRGMPIIRYEVGDMATVASGRCPCGRGLPRLGRVFGRTSDILYAPDGRRISGVSILDTFVIHVPGLQQAQIVQDRLDHIRLRVVRSTRSSGANRWSEESVASIGRAVADVFGPSMQFDLEYVEVIEPTPRGKYQFSICEIDDPAMGSH